MTDEEPTLNELENELRWLLQMPGMLEHFSFILSKKEYQAIEMRMFREKSYAETALKMGITPDSLEELCRSAFESIKIETASCIGLSPLLIKEQNEVAALNQRIKKMEDNNQQTIKKLDILIETITDKINNTRPANQAGAVRLIDIPEIPVKALNVLYKAGIHTIGDLANYTRIDLIKFNNLGKKTIAKLQEAVLPYNIRL